MSHKTKGQKVDLATFLQNDSSRSSLPSAPDPNRDPNERRGGRGRGRGGDRDRDRGGGRGGGGFDRDGPMRSDEDAGPWSRAGPSSRGGGSRFGGDRGDRDGGFGGDRGGGFGGDRGGDRYGDRGGFGGDRGGGFGGDRGGDRYGGDRGGRYGGDRGGFGGDRDGAAPAAERPKLNLQPRTLPVADGPKPSEVDKVTEKMDKMQTTSSSATEPAEKSTDKWETVFRNKSGRSDDRRGGFDRDSDRDGGFGSRGGGYGDRDRGGGYGDRDRGGGYGGSRGGGYSGSSSNRFETEPIDDPRFAGKFGNSGDSRNRGDDRRGQSSGGVTSIPVLAQPNELKKAKAAEERKAAAEEKAAKAAAKAAAEAEERQLKQAAKDAERAAAATKREIAAALVRGGKKGDDLYNEIKAMKEKPLGSGLIGEVVASLEDPNNLKWPAPAEYGKALKSLLLNNDADQMQSMYELQQFYNQIGFPKIDTKTGPMSLWEIVLRLCYQHEVIDHGGFMAWWDDEDAERTEYPGRSTALIQATSFINWLQEEDEEEGEEDEEGGGEDDDSLDEAFAR